MSKKFEGFILPNTTPVPDVVFDELLSELTGNELKTLLYIIRRTYGFGKNADAISLSQFRKGITTKEEKVLDKGCGIEHNRTILVALRALETKGYIISKKRQTSLGDDDTTVYRLHFKDSPEANADDGVVTPRHDGSLPQVTTVVTSGNDGSYPTSRRVVTPGNSQLDSNTRNSIQESTSIATSAEDRAHAENVIHVDVLQRRITDKHKAIRVSDSQRLSERTSDDRDIHIPLSTDHCSDNDNRGPLARDEDSLRSERLPGQARREIEDDFDTHELEMGVINELIHAGEEDDVPTVKMPVVNKPSTSDQLVNNRAQSQTSLSSQGTLQANSGNVIKTPGAGVLLSLATDPPVSRQDDAASGQAISSFSPSQDAAQRTITGADGAVQASDDQVNAVNKVIPKRRAKKAVTQAKPAFVLTEQQQAFWMLWCSIWFNVDIPPMLNETAYSHVKILAPFIVTTELLDSLAEYTRKDLADSQGIKRKRVQLGNLVYCYPGWKQAQQQGTKNISKNGTDLNVYGLQALLERQQKAM